MDTKKEVEVLAAFVHGALAFGHALGFMYNVRKGNKVESVIHAGALAFDLYATAKHVEATKENES